jgi:hypothetical protein
LAANARGRLGHRSIASTAVHTALAPNRFKGGTDASVPLL